MSDKLALALILNRNNKATITNNRNLTLLDIDKLISFHKPSFKHTNQRINQLKKAID